jgi:hypothetical protein
MLNKLVQAPRVPPSTCYLNTPNAIKPTPKKRKIDESSPRELTLFNKQKAITKTETRSESLLIESDRPSSCNLLIERLI